MCKKAKLFIMLLMLIVPMISHAQRWKLRRYEPYIGIGTTSFYGDIGGTSSTNTAMGFKDIQLQYSRPSFVLGFRYKLESDMALKFNLVYGFVAANDAGSRNDARNYAFTSTIFEPSLQFEYYLLSEGRGLSSTALFNKRGMVNNYSRLYIYLYGGLGGVFFDPKPLEDLEAVFKDDFNKFGAVFPVGLGIKYSIDANWSLGLELGRRFTTTDYIDGYTSKFSDHKDTYYIGTFNAIYKIRTDRRGRPLLRSGYYRR